MQERVDSEEKMKTFEEKEKLIRDFLKQYYEQLLGEEKQNTEDRRHYCA